MAACALAVGPLTFAGGAIKWVPSPTSRYQLDLSSTPTTAQLHGTFGAMELDGFDTAASVVAKLHALGKHAVCYIDVGTWESWRPDAASFPKSVLGRPDAGWPGERWLDVRQVKVLLPLMKARFQRCVHKGFDAVDPDNVDGVENDTGFPLTVERAAHLRPGHRSPRARRRAGGRPQERRERGGGARAVLRLRRRGAVRPVQGVRVAGALRPACQGRVRHRVHDVTSVLHAPARLASSASRSTSRSNDWARWCP